MLEIKKKLTAEESHEKEMLKINRDIEKGKYRRENPSILTLACKRLVAFKEKNCPMITWDYTKKED